MYLIYAVLGALLLALLIFSIRRYDKIKQERIFNLRSMRLKVLMSQLNPHFIFNVLNGIQALIVENKPVKASDKLADFSRLLRNTLDASDRSLITIKEDMELIKEYSYFEIQRKNEKIELSISVDPKAEKFYTPPLLIQPIIENSIRHGFKNLKDKNGIIEISVESVNSHINFNIRDNGTGMTHTSDSEYGKGIQLVRERVKIINERNQVDDNFLIQSSNEGTKTSFTLSQIKKPWT